MSLLRSQLALFPDWKFKRGLASFGAGIFFAILLWTPAMLWALAGVVFYAFLIGLLAQRALLALLTTTIVLLPPTGVIAYRDTTSHEASLMIFIGFCAVIMTVVGQILRETIKFIERKSRGSTAPQRPLQGWTPWETR